MITGEAVAGGTAAMMSPRQEAFRADYRIRISPWYSGLVHVVVIALLGIAVIWYAASRIHQPTWAEWLVVPVVFLGCNLFEWALHRFLLHRPVPGFMGIYKRHTLAHHQFFTDNEPTIDDTRDFRITFFPPYAYTTFICMSAAGAGVLSLIWSANAGWLLMCTTAGVYLNYELFHWGCHLKDDRIVRHIPFMNTIRRHHIAHHNQAIMMGMNMNLTYPIADWLFGTSDLDRGLIGHVFNGYDKRFVKPNLKKARATAADSRLAQAEPKAA
jgi:hypothetical protein